MSDIRSSRDYWEDIEPKLNINAKLLDFSGTNPQNTNLHLNTPPEAPSPLKRQANLGEVAKKEKKKANKPAMIEKKEHERQLRELMKKHELELINMKIIAK